MALEAGVPALIALGATTVLSIPLAALYAASLPIAQARVVGLSVVSGCCALFFWIWALRNLKKHFDLGAITFAFAFASSAIGCWAGLGAGSLWSARLFRWAAPLSYVTVSVNYALGLIIIQKPWTLRVYMIVGIVWWLLAGILAWEFASPLVSDLDTLKHDGDLS
eukprot:CAMPEP_0183406430 /NCGR_PEP_ID=MMETSP0370-20130417/16579_1 /TAXON_ID=268820 /ORGANISM="Peridinium aciculiferum, Strain PAER-2" /LENGTH=164 /DNA_ID=CAMNT_0025588597 /DNA_START=51 /DNA_END=545 /DNA_ORIENTATION=-